MSVNIYSNPEKVQKELQYIADQLAIPLNDEKVFQKWVGYNKTVTDDVHKAVIAPLYFTKSQT